MQVDIIRMKSAGAVLEKVKIPRGQSQNSGPNFKMFGHVILSKSGLDK